ERLAGADGSKPAPDALMRTFEALSLTPEPPEPHGRLTEALQPPGFEALTGVAISAAPRHGTAKAVPYDRHGGNRDDRQTGDRDTPADAGVRRVPLQRGRAYT